PAETGLILADGYGAEIVRMGPETKLAGARRKALTLRFARLAARREQAARDPDWGSDGTVGWGGAG
ncbi:MAG: MmcB family DNA repair protein, partial [Pseudomonadota bacterium]